VAGVALALALATPLALAASPVFAAGDDAVVDADVTPGNVHVSSTKGLSRVTVVLCDGSTVVANSWGGSTSGDVAVDGIVRAVFIHSGNNTTDEAEALLEALAGPDALSGESTGAIAVDDADACDPDEIIDNGDDEIIDNGDDEIIDNGDDEIIDNGDDEIIDNGDDEIIDNGDDEVIDNGDDDNGGGNRDENGDPNNGDGNNGGGGNTDTTPVVVVVSDPAPGSSAPSTPADPAPSTSVLGGNVEQIPTVVMGATLEAGAELPRTGSGDVVPLMRLALSLVGAGLALRTVSSRRIRSASSPG
jgi:hypothetical protein